MGEFFKMLAIVFWLPVAFVVIYAAFRCGQEVGEENQKRKAAEFGVAQYSFSSTTGKAEFSYVKPALPLGMDQ